MPPAFINTAAGDNLWIRLGKIFGQAARFVAIANESYPGSNLEDSPVPPEAYHDSIGSLLQNAYDLTVAMAYEYGSGGLSDSPSGITVPADRSRLTIARYLRAAMNQYDGHSTGATIAPGSVVSTLGKYRRHDGTSLSWGTGGAWSTVGYPLLVASTINDEGVSVPTLRTETLKATCIDAATQTVSVTGDIAYPSRSHLWPGGTATAMTMVVGENNIHRNSEMEYASSGKPSRLTYTTGGSIVAQSATQAFSNTYSMSVTGDASTKPEIRLEHGRVAGTPLTLAPNTTYILGAMLRADASISAGATIDFDICNGAGTTVYGGPYNFAADTGVGNLSTSEWRFRGVVFTTGASIADGLCSRIKFKGTALASGKIVYIDDWRCQVMRRGAPGAPPCAVWPGNIAMTRGDRIEMGVSATRADWNNWLDRMFDLHTLGVVLPTSGSPSVSSGLIA